MYRWASEMEKSQWSCTHASQLRPAALTFSLACSRRVPVSRACFRQLRTPPRHSWWLALIFLASSSRPWAAGGGGLGGGGHDGRRDGNVVRVTRVGSDAHETFLSRTQRSV